MGRPVGQAGKGWLLAGGLLSTLASFLHLGIIAGGPEWYRFFGAGERMARMAEQGSPRPTLITLAVALILFIWAAYAFAGAGLLRRLPLMRTALVTITMIYLLRGMVLFPALAAGPAQTDAFTIWSSAIVLVYGIVHAAGTWKSWSFLSQRPLRGSELLQRPSRNRLSALYFNAAVANFSLWPCDGTEHEPAHRRPEEQVR